MYVLVCFGNAEESKVGARYLTSEFMERAVATDVLEKFESALQKEKIIEASSDRPNVNLKFLEMLDEKRKDSNLSKLISIGTCGLHTLNLAFQNGENTTGWNLSSRVKFHFVPY